MQMPMQLGRFGKRLHPPAQPCGRRAANHLGHGGQGFRRALGLAEQLRDFAHEAAKRRPHLPPRLQTGATVAEGLLPIQSSLPAPDQTPHIQARDRGAGDALDHHHGLLHEHELRLRLHVEQRVVLRRAGRAAAPSTPRSPAAEDRLADGAQRLREVATECCAVHNRPRNAPAATRRSRAQEAGEGLGHEAARLHARRPMMPKSTATSGPRRRRTDCRDACRRGRSRRAWRDAGKSASRCGPSVSRHGRRPSAPRDRRPGCRRSIRASARGAASLPVDRGTRKFVVCVLSRSGGGAFHAQIQFDGDRDGQRVDVRDRAQTTRR